LLGERVRLVLVGEGESRPDIERSVVPEKARFVTLTGPRRDVAALLSAFDLFALSSRTEGLPLAIPEAMATALPVVATAVGGLPSSVPSYCGVLVPAGDEVALRCALAALTNDSVRSRAMGRSARGYALARFSIDRMTDAYESLYREP
jgi:glycosyltransferase involved in cell wall biosynthesis